MKRLYLLRIFSVLSLLFGTLLGVFPLACNILYSLAAFVLLSLMAFAFYPLLKKRLERMDYFLQKRRFKWGTVILAAAFVISLCIHGLVKTENSVIPYVLLYLVTSIVLLRTFRYVEYGGSAAEIGRVNLRDAFVLIGAAFLLSIRFVRQGLFWLLSHAYNLLVDVLYFVLYWLFNGFGYVIHLTGFALHPKAAAPTGNGAGKPPVIPHSQGAAGPSLLLKILESQAFSIALHVLVLLLLVFLIYRIYRSHAQKARGIKIDYSEQKEFLTAGRQGGSRQQVSGRAVFRQADTIRRIYRKFLRLCGGAGILLKATDTTLEINEKFLDKFDIRAALKLRALYVAARYGTEKADAEDTAEMGRQYREIRRQMRH